MTYFDGAPITDIDREIFAREWQRGTPTKLICRMLTPERTPSALRTWRLEMGLPRRQRRRGTSRRDVADIHVEMPVAWREAINRRAHEKRLTVSGYIRGLVEADLLGRAP